MTVIDVHTHMLDREWLRLLKESGAPRYEVGPITEELEGIYADGALRQRYYFEIPIDPGVINTLVLHEGAGMRLMTAGDIAEETLRFVPYDLAILRMHMLIREGHFRNAGVEDRAGQGR